MAEKETAVAKSVAPPVEVGKVRLATMRDLLEKMRGQLSMALPKHLPVERLMRVAMTQVQRTPKLLECEPKSFLGAIMTAAQVGLEPDGFLGRGYLIPRWNKNTRRMECHFQPGYKGLLDLCQRSGNIASVRADVVRQGDFIEYEKGLDERLVHREGVDNFEATITHVYAIIRTKDGGSYWDIWPAAKVEAHRRRFAPDSYESFSAWQTDWAAMGKKTLLIAVSNLAPKSIELARAVAAQQASDAGLPQDLDLVDVEEPARDGKARTLADLAKSPKTIGAGESGGPRPGPVPAEPEPPAPTAPAAVAEIPLEERSLDELAAIVRNGMPAPDFTALIRNYGGERGKIHFGLDGEARTQLCNELLERARMLTK